MKRILAHLTFLAATTLSASVVPILATPVDYHIIEQNEQLTTDIPGATITGKTDHWTVNLPSTDSASGVTTIPEPAGETGLNVAIGFGSNAIGVDSESTVGGIGAPLQITDQNGVHNVIFQDLPPSTNGAPDGSPTFALLSISLLALGGFVMVARSSALARATQAA